MNKNSHSIIRLTQLSILIAIMLIFAFTPLGYLKTAIIEISFMPIPIAVGAIVLGPSAGAILGLIFGITSFIQCFGMSPFGAFLLGLNPVYTFIMCIIPRILCGFLPGVIFKLLIKLDKTKMVSYFVSALSVALFNTAFFVGSIILLFWKNPAFIEQMNAWNFSTDTIWVFFVAFVAINGVVEAAVSLVVGGGVAKTIHKLVKSGQ